MCCVSAASWTEVLTAIGTVGAVLVALFGYFLSKLLPPQLAIGVADPRGVRQRVQLIDRSGAIPVRSRDAWARYYHIEITNKRRWTKAHNAQVQLLRVEEETPSGWVDVWAGGGIRLVWQHEHATGPVRNVGPAVHADLLHVVQDADPAKTKWLELTPTFAPYGVELRYRTPTALRLTLQATSDETDSAPLVVTVRWNGKWEDGALEMANHVRLETG